MRQIVAPSLFALLMVGCGGNQTTTPAPHAIADLAGIWVSVTACQDGPITLDLARPHTGDTFLGGMARRSYCGGSETNVIIGASLTGASDSVVVEFDPEFEHNAMVNDHLEFRGAFRGPVTLAGVIKHTAPANPAVPEVFGTFVFRKQ